MDMCNKIKMAILGRFLRNKQGATAIEFALLAPIMFALMLVIIEVGLLAYTSVALESVVTQAGREASIGTPETAGTTRSEFVTNLIKKNASSLIGNEALRIDSHVIVVTDNAQEPTDEVFDICLDPYGVGIPDCAGAFEDVNGNGQYDGREFLDDFGGSTEVVQINVALPWRANFGIVRSIVGENGFTVLRASTIVKNEPF